MNVRIHTYYSQEGLEHPFSARVASGLRARPPVLPTVVLTALLAAGAAVESVTVPLATWRVLLSGSEALSALFAVAVIQLPYC
jgi:hypothetical protein